MLEYLIVIPAHNEEKYLRECVEKVHKVLTSFTQRFLLVIAEDGSVDGTSMIASSLAEEYRQVIHIHRANKLGRGIAVQRVWESIEANVYAFMDCDLAVDLRYFEPLLESINSGVDIATGSRYLPDSHTSRPLLRKIVSRIYNKTIASLFGTGCSDHQCGFKAVSNVALKQILRNTLSKGWAWDTELLVIAKKLGLKIAEIPVVWTEKRSNHTPLLRLLKDIGEHGFWIVKFFCTAKLHHSQASSAQRYRLTTDELALISKRSMQIMNNSMLTMKPKLPV
jgi:glycosyltransferase involved in cell wall biosynthesis